MIVCLLYFYYLNFIYVLNLLFVYFKHLIIYIYAQIFGFTSTYLSFFYSFL